MVHESNALQVVKAWCLARAAQSQYASCRSTSPAVDEQDVSGKLEWIRTRDGKG